MVESKYSLLEATRPKLPGHNKHLSSTWRLPPGSIHTGRFQETHERIQLLKALGLMRVQSSNYVTVMEIKHVLQHVNTSESSP